MIGPRFLHGFLATLFFGALTACQPACGGETAPLAITPHAVVFSTARNDGESPTHVLLFDVPVSCSDARCLDKGAPPGARFKAVVDTRAWKVGTLELPGRAALFDAQGVVSTSASGGTEEPGRGVARSLSWGTFELLTAPRVKGEVARLRGSASGTFSVYPSRRGSEEYDLTTVSSSEPDRQEFSFARDIDVTLCSDIVDAK